MNTPAWSRSQWVALLSLSFAVFMVSLDVTVVVVSLPKIQTDLGLSLAQLQWVVTSYSLVFAGLLLSAGVLADRFGRRRTFFLGLALFALSSGAAGLANTAWVLNAARAVQGLGAAFLLSSAGALLAQIFPGPDRTRAFGVWGTVIGIGLAFGPLIGGFITRHVGWHWIFLINLPVAVAIFAGVQKTVSAIFTVHKRPLDWIGMTSFTAGLFGIIYALSTLHPGAHAETGTEYAAAGGILLLVIFFASQRWQREPMIDLALLRNKAFVGITLMPILLSISYWSLLVFLPQYFELSRGLDALGSGIALLPLTLPMLMLPPFGAKLAHRLPRHVHFSLSFALVGLGAIVMYAGLHAHGALLIAGMLLTGTGSGLINAQMTNVAVSVVPHERSGMATGISGTMRQAGFVFAIALHTLLIEQVSIPGQAMSSEVFNAGLGRILMTAMAASAAAVLIALAWLRYDAVPASAETLVPLD
ncbi:MFS transporter [Undibacterium sp. TJN25]|uniref:MFS transporter n=1 Tax=Undibacterium sp. TJN25 TaxID=3413056 RepID=UPI003BF3BD5E